MIPKMLLVENKAMIKTIVTTKNMVIKMMLYFETNIEY